MCKKKNLIMDTKIVFMPITERGTFIRSGREINEFPIELILFVERVMTAVAVEYECSGLLFFKESRDENITEAKDLVYKILQEKTWCDWRALARLLWLKDIAAVNRIKHRHHERMASTDRCHLKYQKAYKQLSRIFPDMKVKFKDHKLMIVETDSSYKKYLYKKTLRCKGIFKNAS